MVGAVVGVVVCTVVRVMMLVLVEVVGVLGRVVVAEVLVGGW